MLLFVGKKPPEAEHAEGLAQGSVSLAVRSTDVGPNMFQKVDMLFDQFLKFVASSGIFATKTHTHTVD